MYITKYKDIVFIEGIHKEAKQVKKIEAELLGIGAHLRSLRDVKERLYLFVKQNDGNCLMDFRYGQKQRILAIDDIAFFGSGIISVLPNEVYEKIMNEDND